MRRRLPLLGLLLLLAAGLLLLRGHEPQDVGRPLGDADAPGHVEPEAITLRGRAAVDAEPTAAPTPEPTPAVEEAPGEPPVLLVVRVELDGAPEGTPLDPPANVQVSALTDPIDSFFSMGVVRSATATGEVEVDVRSVLGEIGRLGRAPELGVIVHRPGGLVYGRTILVEDAEGLLQGRGGLEPLAFRLPRTTLVRGRVLSHDGKPIPYAEVHAYPFPGDAPQARSVHGMSVGEDGAFALALPGEGRFLVVASAAHFTEPRAGVGHAWLPSAREITVEPGVALEDVELRLDAGRWVEGEVVHPASGAVEGEGRIAWRLEGDAQILGHRQGDFAWVDGEVVWAGGEAAIVGGRFRVQGLPPLDCLLAVRQLADCFLPRAVGEVQLPPDATTVRLEPACAALEIRAAVADGDTAPDAWTVRLHPADEPPRRRVADGSRILVSPETDVEVEVVDGRFQPARVPARAGGAGSTTVVELPLVRMATADLVVHLHLPDGRPYAGWVACLAADPDSSLHDPRGVWERAGHAGADGVLRLQKVPEGRWRLHVRPGRSTFWHRPMGYLERTAEVAVPSRREPAATLVVEGGGRLVVSLRARDGSPRAGTIRIAAEDGAPVPAVFVPETGFLTGERGAVGELPAAARCWLATALSPGPYELEIRAEGGAPVRRTIHAQAGSTSAISITVD